MKDPDHTGIPIRVSLLLFMGEDHDVGTSMGINGVLFMSQVIHCVVYMQNTMVI
jgi:hypothetical protein